MRSFKPYLYCGFFLTLAALRRAFPQQAEQAFIWLHAALDPGGFCRAFAIEVGRALDSDSFRDGLIAAVKLFGEVLA